MFGYIQINQKELKIREYEKYRSYYCGLCHVLKDRYGRDGQMLLNYDMTFLAILLTGLYEQDTQTQKLRCVVHPLIRHQECISEATGYAADMTMMLAYQKALDDWRDDRKKSGRIRALLSYNDYKKLRQQYPRQAKVLERCVRELSEAEKSGQTNPDYVAGLTGEFLGEMFAWKNDVWQDDLWEMGFYLGKFIYLMDAWDDLEKDRKKNRYNLLQFLQDEDPQTFEQRAKSMMTDMISRSCRAFERLPILNDAGILRNILYGGVWVRYTVRSAERNKKAHNTGKGNDNTDHADPAGQADQGDHADSQQI